MSLENSHILANALWFPLSHFLSCTELILPRFKVQHSVVTNRLNTSAIFAIGGYKSSGERHRSLSSVMGTKKLPLSEVGLSTLWIFTSIRDKSCAQRKWHTSLIIQYENWYYNGIIIYVSGNIVTYTFPKPTFCLKWEVSVKPCWLREGVGGQFPRNV